jgi:phenylpropionate dioxygenase-like ring-hydroxylating dioxygenase large terminal subunit
LREPVENYRRPERLHSEIERVLRRYPVAFCPAAALPEPGSYVARAAAGVPVIAVRGHDGVIRAFRNACRHCGTALVDGAGCAAALVCPYHGWVHRLDGSLRHVPDAHGFPDLDRSTHGLAPIHALIRGVVVFVSQAELAPDAVLDALPDVVASDQELIGAGEVVLDANWKVLLEGFLEGYHIKATHRTTFFPFGFDNLNVAETFGRNSRVTFPFRRINELRDRPPHTWRADRVVTTVHHPFPNTIVARLSHHTTMVVLELLGEAPRVS